MEQDTNPSCANCPSFIPEDQAVSTLGRSVNFPMCKKYGKALGNPNFPYKWPDVQAHVASTCPDYGAPAPDKRSKIPVAFMFNPILPMEDPDPVNNCFQCKFMVKASDMYETHNVPLSGCSAQGAIIMDATQAANQCGLSVAGSPSVKPDSMIPRDPYTENFSVIEIRKEKALLTAVSSVAPPEGFKTQAEVTDEERADGICAWRRVDDPSGSGKHVFLPVFDPEFFDETERSFIPRTGDEHHPELYVDYGSLLWRFAVDSWTLNETLLIQSDPGLGKTEFTYWLAWLMQLPWRRVAFKTATEYDEVFGTKNYTPDEGIFWQDGRFTRAWRSHACILCVDEPNLANNAIIESLRTTTDTDGMLYIDGAVSSKDGVDDERRLMVGRGKYVFQVWCMNPSWDIRNIGTKEIANADVDRLTPAILPYPPATLEKHIISERVKTLDDWELSENQLNLLIDIATDIREMAENGDFPGSWGMRQQIKVARKLQWYTPEEAFRMAALNYYEPETADMVVRSIKTRLA